MKQEKKTKIVTIIGIATLLLVVVGATYAYFTAQMGEGTGTNLNAQAGTTDNLFFTQGDAINIHASQEDFGKNMGNKTGNTTTVAKLIPNNQTNRATKYYNVFFVIDRNDFIYTTNINEVELLLKVKGPDESEITSISGLTYNEELQGFDITTERGIFRVKTRQSITATSQEGTSQNWYFEVTLRNLDSDQNDNSGKTFRGKVIVTGEEKESYIIPELNNITEESKTNNSITINLQNNSESHPNDIDKYYYAIEETTERLESAKIMTVAEKLTPKYTASNEATYTFTQLTDGTPIKENTTYKVYAYFVDKLGISSEIKTAIITTDNNTPVKVTGFTVSTRNYSSIKIKATAEAGTNEVKEYAFRIENHNVYGNWSAWQESDEYIFENLIDNKYYNIQVKVRDTENKESICSFDRNEQTIEYDYFTLGSEIIEKTSRDILVQFQVSEGSKTATKVEVKLDGTDTWNLAERDESADFSSYKHYKYHFQNLEKKTEYSYKVRITDSNNRVKIYTPSKIETLDRYTVNLVVNNGTVETNNFEVDDGKSLTVTITPNDGYDISRAEVSGESCDYGNIEDHSFILKWIHKDNVCNIDIPLKPKTPQDVCSNGMNLATCIKNIYNSYPNEKSNIYLHNSNLAYSANDGSYRYAGNDPYNYVCFGSGSEDYNNGNSPTCPEKNLYRIIGVYGSQVRLIKNYPLTTSEINIDSEQTNEYETWNDEGVYKDKFPWSGSSTLNSPDWSTSGLKNALNSTSSGGYLYSIGTTWANKIASQTWYYHGIEDSRIYTLHSYETNKSSFNYQEIFDHELGNNKDTSKTVTAKVGLPYASEIGYSALPDKWSHNLIYSYGSKAENINNWLSSNYYSSTEWGISVEADYNSFIMKNYSHENIYYMGNSSLVCNFVRPTFLLTSSITYKGGGNGDFSTPLRIN